MNSESTSEEGTQTREHLANERTLLAWVRTAVSLTSFGLVVESVGAYVGSVGSSGLFGIGLAVLGCLTLIVGTARFVQSRRRIARGIAANSFVPTAAPYMIIVVASLILAGMFVAYVLLGD
jgi:putative membrane protein